MAKRTSGQDATDLITMAKLFCGRVVRQVADDCIQFHGGYGYMMEYPIARAYLDTRAATLYAGTTEIMKEIVGRSMGF